MITQKMFDLALLRSEIKFQKIMAEREAQDTQQPPTQGQMPSMPTQGQMPSLPPPMPENTQGPMGQMGEMTSTNMPGIRTV